MILFPAIDLKDGRCVRLLRGDMRAATVFNDDAGDQARRFLAAGAEFLHVVDLNGAFAGHAANAVAVEAIVAETRRAGARVQLGGGIRSEADIERWLAAGVTRAILGIALGMQTQTRTASVLLAVFLVHQLLEALSLGHLIASLQHRAEAMVMIALTAASMPVGIVIGIVVVESV